MGGKIAVCDLDSAYKLILSMAWQFYRKCPHSDIEVDDLVGFGWEGVSHASRLYDEGRGSFITYCWYWIYNYINRGINSWGRVKLSSGAYATAVFTDEEVSCSDDRHIELGLMVPGLVDRVMSLDEKLRNVLILRYFLGHTVPVTSGIMGIPWSAVHELEGEAITAMRELYNNGSDGAA